MKSDQKKKLQIIWSSVLMITGICVFLRIPYVMPKIEEIDQFSRCTKYIKFCFYFIGIFLIGAGFKKAINKSEKR